MTERRNIKKKILCYLSTFQYIKRHIVVITDLRVFGICNFPYLHVFISAFFLYSGLNTRRFMLILLNDFDFLQLYNVSNGNQLENYAKL